MGDRDSKRAGEERIRLRPHEREDGSRERRRPDHDRRGVWLP